MVRSLYTVAVILLIVYIISLFIGLGSYIHSLPVAAAICILIRIIFDENNRHPL